MTDNSEHPYDPFLALDSRTLRVLRYLGVSSLLQLSKRTERELLRQRSFGSVRVERLKKLLADNGLKLREEGAK